MVTYGKIYKYRVKVFTHSLINIDHTQRSRKLAVVESIPSLMVIKLIPSSTNMIEALFPYISIETILSISIQVAVDIFHLAPKVHTSVPVATTFDLLDERIG